MTTLVGTIVGSNQAGVEKRNNTGFAIATSPLTFNSSNTTSLADIFGVILTFPITIPANASVDDAEFAVVVAAPGKDDPVVDDFYVYLTVEDTATPDDYATDADVYNRFIFRNPAYLGSWGPIDDAGSGVESTGSLPATTSMLSLTLADHGATSQVGVMLYGTGSPDRVADFQLSSSYPRYIVTISIPSQVPEQRARAMRHSTIR